MFFQNKKKYPKCLTQHKADISKKAHFQVGGTCYANAIATVFRAAQARIIGQPV